MQDLPRVHPVGENRGARPGRGHGEADRSAVHVHLEAAEGRLRGHEPPGFDLPLHRTATELCGSLLRWHLPLAYHPK